MEDYVSIRMSKKAQLGIFYLNPCQYKFSALYKLMNVIAMSCPLYLSASGDR